MAELTAEQYNQLPEFIRADYEREGEKYVSVAEKKARALKDSLNNLDAKYKTEVGSLNERLSNFEKQQAEAVEKARAEALAQAKNKGDIDAIEKRYQEQMEDIKRRTAEETRNELQKEWSMEKAKDKAAIDVADIAAKLRPLEGAEGALKLIIQSRQKIGEDGKVFYTNADGSASALDAAGLAAELQKDPAVKRLISGTTNTHGGGNANGSIGNGSAVTVGKMGGTRAEREAAIRQKFNLPN